MIELHFLSQLFFYLNNKIKNQILPVFLSQKRKCWIQTIFLDKAFLKILSTLPNVQNTCRSLRWLRQPSLYLHYLTLRRQREGRKKGQLLLFLFFCCCFFAFATNINTIFTNEGMLFALTDEKKEQTWLFLVWLEADEAQQSARKEVIPGWSCVSMAFTDFCF